MAKKYIILFNPHDDEYKMFEYVDGRKLYAPNYGCCISNGKTREECFESAHQMFNIQKDEVIPW